MPHSKLGNPETLILDKKKRRIREPDQRSGRYGKEAVHYFQNLLKKVEESSLGKPIIYPRRVSYEDSRMLTKEVSYEEIETVCYEIQSRFDELW